MGTTEDTDNLAFIVGPGAVRKYVEYLSTEEAVSAYGRSCQRLRGRLSTHQREVWEHIKADLADELARRQLKLL